VIIRNIFPTVPLHKTERLPLNKEKTLTMSNSTRINESQEHDGSDDAILVNDVIKGETTVNKE
jgi:hypothetical protein